MSLPMMNVPKYEMVLPSDRRKIQYRPFVVKEEKSLLIAIQENDPKHMVFTIKQLLEACTFGKINVDELPQVDVEYLFLNIRNKSMGEGVEVASTCVHCEAQNHMTLDLSKATVEYPKEKVESEIKLTDSIYVNMKYPTLESSYKMKGEDDYKDVMLILATCIVSIIDGENVYDCTEQKPEEIVEWLESLTREQFAKIDAFFASMPKIVFNDTYRCIKCGETNNIHIEGLQSFFD